MRWIALALLAAGCYDPELSRRPDGGDGAIDAATSSSPDAPAPCQALCVEGTCDGDVCVIDCSADSACPDDVFCPAGIPCRVICGDSGCGHHVDCKEAPACEVECSGTDSCKDEIRCPIDGPCTVTCSGFDACSKRIRCKDSCACDVACTGGESCDEPAECPDTGSCRVGDGCSSAPEGCDTCSTAAP